MCIYVREKGRGERERGSNLLRYLLRCGKKQYKRGTQWNSKRERKRGTETAMTDTRLRQIYSELCFFVLLLQEADKDGGHCPQLAPKTTWLVYTADCSPRRTLGSKTSIIIYFLHPHIFPFGTIHIVFLMSFVYLKTQLQILFTKSILTGHQKSICNRLFLFFTLVYQSVQKENSEFKPNKIGAFHVSIGIMMSDYCGKRRLKLLVAGIRKKWEIIFLFELLS